MCWFSVLLSGGKEALLQMMSKQSVKELSRDCKSLECYATGVRGCGCACRVADGLTDPTCVPSGAGVHPSLSQTSPTEELNCWTTTTSPSSLFPPHPPSSWRRVVLSTSHHRARKRVKDSTVNPMGPRLLSTIYLS